jgi:hypothetical protein
LTLHPYKEPRFLLIAAPALWLAAAWNVVTIAEVVFAPARAPRSSVNLAFAAIALGALILLSPVSPTLPAAFARYTVPASTAPMVDRVVELVEERPTLLLGTWNQASPPLIEWRWLQRASSASGPRSGEGIVLDVAVPGQRAGTAEKVLRRLRGPSAPQQVVMLNLDATTAPSPEWSAAFVAETEWLSPVRRELEAGAGGYFDARVRSFAAPGYAVRVYRTRP